MMRPMPYDERLAGRIRNGIDERVDVEERRMFGGIAFLVGGHMAVGIVGDAPSKLERAP